MLSVCVGGGGEGGGSLCVCLCVHVCMLVCLVRERGGVSVRYRLGQKLVKGRVDN